MSPGMGGPRAPWGGGEGPWVPHPGSPPSAPPPCPGAARGSPTLPWQHRVGSGPMRPLQGGSGTPSPKSSPSPLSLVPPWSPLTPWSLGPPALLRPDTTWCISWRATSCLPPCPPVWGQRGSGKRSGVGGRWSSPRHPRTPRPPTIAPCRLPETGPSGRHLPRGGRGPVPAALVQPHRAAPCPCRWHCQAVRWPPVPPRPIPGSWGRGGGRGGEGVVTGGLLSISGGLVTSQSSSCDVIAHCDLTRVDDLPHQQPAPLVAQWQLPPSPPTVPKLHLTPGRGQPSDCLVTKEHGEGTSPLGPPVLPPRDPPSPAPRAATAPAVSHWTIPRGSFA